MFSQVEGFEVADRNISSATQEIDINVINRNTGGPLGGGAIVLAEAKNWSSPVDRKEYNAFAAKLRTRRGMAKLGFLVTTNRFTKPCYLEHLGERYLDDLIVLLDQERLPAIWRAHSSVTEGIERMVISAIYDHEVR
jgi:restriction endonuclease Mrr